MMTTDRSYDSTFRMAQLALLRQRHLREARAELRRLEQLNNLYTLAAGVGCFAIATFMVLVLGGWIR